MATAREPFSPWRPGLIREMSCASFSTGSTPAGLGVNLDAANLLMNGFDPYQAARALQGRIVYVQAKDARRAAQEVPLGHGDLDWLQYIGVLEEVEYRGWITVKRETGSKRLADVATGVQFLRRFVGGLDVP